MPDGNFSGFDSTIIEVSDGIAFDNYLKFSVTNVNDTPLSWLRTVPFKSRETL